MHSGSMQTTHQTVRRRRLNRQLDAVILHFDYDCFYASVFENENPELRSLPLAVQQKQIVVTCNYEARRRGLYKLQLIRDAKRICPDVVIVLGEDLTRFRDASKDLYLFLRSFSWNQKVERLGFDEVFMDVSDIIDYNLALLNHHDDLSNSFFRLSKSDPTAGFSFDASQIAGNTFPEASDAASVNDSSPNGLRLRLHLGSHLAQYLRVALRTQKGYTCTAGVSTNKVLAKLVGNLHKPDNQTTLLPPYENGGDGVDNVTSFVDEHEVRKIPGIGFKLAEKLRNFVLDATTPEPADEIGHEPKQTVLVSDVKRHPAIGPGTLEKVLGGAGVPHGIGHRVWDLLHGCDDTPVGQARDLPRQISIEDSYGQLDSEAEVIKQLKILSASLLRRMHADLTVAEEEMVEGQANSVTESRDMSVKKRWLAFPRTIRLSTRPRASRNAGGSRYGTPSHRISRSTQMPNFIFSQKESVTALADRLAAEVLLPLFRKLHPEKTWDLSLINVAATDIVDAASEKGGPGRDIKDMFKRQDDVLKQWRVEETTNHAVVEKEEVIEKSASMVNTGIPSLPRTGSEDLPTRSQEAAADDEWDDGDEEMLDEDMFRCELCGSAMPSFAMTAHERWHASSG